MTLKAQTYTAADMAKLFLRVATLTRENTELREQLRKSRAAVAELAEDNQHQLGRLADLEGHYARQRTTAITIPLQRQFAG